ncbi:hypothetical protein SAMN02746098_03722 [Desulfosporosinus lacus DSM 15449]|uniref:Uncharacterized protein n=1 Tax=Desulfosporosinus lacus DSM 15449 TaxID=1121420 RepID=A0A1M5ZV55_9FIRM|nr:hypothetical protein SAMN02746098_03722 [Desulfosporosinus lacus DSM 15449]
MSTLQNDYMRFLLFIYLLLVESVFKLMSRLLSTWKRVSRHVPPKCLFLNWKYVPLGIKMIYFHMEVIVYGGQPNTI